MTPRALREDRCRLASRVNTVTSRAVGGAHLRPLCYQFGMTALRVILSLGRVAGAAKCGDFVGRGDTIGRRVARRRSMLHARSVTGVATEPLGEMRVSLEIVDLCGVTGGAKLMRGLNQPQREQPGHSGARRTSLRVTDAILGVPASPIDNLSSALSIHRTRSTPA